MTWNINYAESVKKDIQKLDVQVKRRMKDFIETRIACIEDPRSLGEALKGAKFGQYWKFRLGDYRIISEIQDHKLTILVIKVGHRREVYK